MSYEGVKYKTIITDSLPPDDPRCDQLRKWCKVFHQNKLAPYYDGGTHGNMSFRLNKNDNSFIITAARSSFEEHLSDDSFFTIQKVDFERMSVYANGSGEREPSSETLLHAAIFNNRPDVQAILHGHCNSITRHSEKMGIPTTEYFVESGNMVIVESVLAIIDGHSFIEIKDHGFLAMAGTIDDAGKLSMDMLEKSKKFDRSEI